MTNADPAEICHSCRGYVVFHDKQKARECLGLVSEFVSDCDDALDRCRAPQEEGYNMPRGLTWLRIERLQGLRWTAEQDLAARDVELAEAKRLLGAMAQRYCEHTCPTGPVHEATCQDVSAFIAPQEGDAK